MISPGRPLAIVLLLATLPVKAQVDKARQDEILHLLKHDCGSCHGMTLKGGLAPALTADALRDKPPQYLESVILDGRPGTPMPPWRKFINTQEVRWLVKQLQSGDVNRGND
jgi:cytochrome c55X